jgi:hypothetical protein
MTRSPLAAFSVIVFLATSLLAQSNPVPFVNQPLVPTTVAPGSPAFTLTVNGTGFVAGSVVNWNGSPRVSTFVSSSRLMAAITAADVAVAGTATVAVNSPSPGGGVSTPVYLGVTNPFSQITFTTSTFGSLIPLGMTAADLNRDGKLDLVTANENGDVSVFLGNGDGTFQAGRDYVVGSQSNELDSVVAVDVNGDGKLDLIACLVSTAQVGVLLGNGDGTFGTASLYATNGGLPQSILVADFNGDGFTDIAVANYGSNTIGVLLGNGDGTFRTAINSASSFGPEYFVVGDFNKDGKLDVVTSAPDAGGISIMLGNGDGTFKPPVTYPAGFGPLALVSGDFNGDGNLDVVVTSNMDAQTNPISVFLGNGDGTFQPYVQFNVGDFPSQIVAGDLDGDGKLDLIVMNSDIFFGGPTLSVLFGVGNGTFLPQVVFPVAANSTIVPGDFNGDGRLDLAIADRSHANISLLTQIPSVNLSPTALSFPNQIVGTTSSAQTITLTNASNTPLTISSISISGTHSAVFAQTNTCPSTLNAGANCAITVTYTPSLVGSDSATLTVMDSGAPNTQTVALTGNSIGPIVKLSNLTLSFGNQVVGTVSAAQTVTLKNNGTLALTISSIAANGNFSQTNTCGSSVAVGASCSITAKFTPTVIGDRTGAITISDNAGPPTQIIHLFGTGTDVSLSTLSLTFAPQKVGTTSPPSSIRLTNVGRTTLTFSSFTISGVNAADFAEGNNCGSSLAGGHSCTISATFTPSATGSRNASLSITDNGGGSPQSVTLQGTGK